MEVIDDSNNITTDLATAIDWMIERSTIPCECGCRIIIPAKTGTYILECPACRKRKVIRKD